MTKMHNETLTQVNRFCNTHFGLQRCVGASAIRFMLGVIGM